MSSKTPCPDPIQIGNALRAWYEQPLGRLLATAEQTELDRILPDLFGYHLLQVCFAAPSRFTASRILHCAVMAAGSQDAAMAATLRGDSAALPVTSYSLDALILHHVLEFAPDPRQVLREAERVLVPEGHVLILGFNPRSLWGLRGLLSRRPLVPWCGRFLSAPRVKDWLNVLGFESVSCQPVLFHPPLERHGLLRHPQLMQRLSRYPWLFHGGAYILLARKKVMTLTPIKPRWRPRRARMGLADPAARRWEHDGSR